MTNSCSKYKNFEDWLAFLKELLANYASDDIGSYVYFAMFLRRLAKEKPTIAFKLLSVEELTPFLNNVLAGLLDSTEKQKVRELLVDYSKEKTKQLATIQALLSKRDFDESLFKELYPILVESTDTTVLLALLQTIIRNCSTHKNHKEKVTAIINKFTTLSFFSWSFVHHISSDYWKEMSGENTIAILENLKYCSNVSYEEECMLSSIAEKNPKAIISFFHDRVELSKAKKISNPIPFEFLILNTSLSTNHKEILPEIIKWFSEEDQLANWYASKLVENIFPSFGSDLESFLLTLVKKNDKKDLKIVLHILEEYEGQPFLHNIIKEIIKLHPMDKELRATLYQILSKIGGVVGGEYGFLDAYKRKKEETRSWLTDISAEVKGFAAEYHKHLDELINQQKDRADKEITFRKREFEVDRR